MNSAPAAPNIVGSCAYHAASSAGEKAREAGSGTDTTLSGSTLSACTHRVTTRHQPAGNAADDESRVEVYVTTDTSAAPHKAGEPKLYVMYDAANPDGDKLYFTEAEWDAFVLGVKDGEFDLDESGQPAARSRPAA